jgi:catechol 2,3-dioxygenase-like lactoylglutathione lyase family enzyme
MTGFFRRLDGSAYQGAARSRRKSLHEELDGEYVTQVTAIGPLGLEYLDPTNVPRKQPTALDVCRQSKASKPEELDMSITQERSEAAIETPRTRTIDMKLEVVVIPVSDVDRAKRFYGGLGWRLDADFGADDDYRVVQFTPPGSGCSVIFGKNVTAAVPGSAQGLYLIVSDIDAARHELLGRGVEVSKVFHDAGEVHAGTDEPYLFGRLRVSGPDPDRRTYRSYASFRDPDGNGWLLQEVTGRLPGRVNADTTFPSSTELATALRRASAAHGEHEKRIGKHDDNWPDWYADYIVREQIGKELPS